MNIFLIRSKIYAFAFLIFIFCNTIICGQTNSFQFGFENQLLDKKTKDSIFENNELCQRYLEVASLDTFFWNKFPTINFDDIPILKKITANDLFKHAVELKKTFFYNKEPFNLFGTYSETEYRNNLNTFQNLKTKIKVYDSGFNKNQLVNATTQYCEEVNKSPDFQGSIFDSFITTLGGTYSNLYYVLDLDFLRMYNVPYSDKLGGDRRIWTADNLKNESGNEDYNYYKAFKMDSSIYVVIVNKKEYSNMNRLSKRPSMNYLGKSENAKKDIQSELKYVLINLSTMAIENTKYYHISLSDSASIYPNRVTSYETTYNLVGEKYYLKNINLNNFLFNPSIDHISFSGISFSVDSVVNSSNKVERIKDSEADQRKVNYLEQYLKNYNWSNNEKQ
jgi:hypothetical protein